VLEGRRYFRFFRFLDCFSRAYDCFTDKEGMEGVLGTCKWSCMGAYLGLESVTIVSLLLSLILGPDVGSWMCQLLRRTMLRWK